MGTGRIGRYVKTIGGSQLYAELYRVLRKMLEMDKKEPDIYDHEEGYFHNPSAISLREARKGNKFYQRNGETAHGEFTYVMDKNGEIIFGKRENPNKVGGRSPHPTLLGGKDPEVACAGIIEFRDGRIFRVDNQSGHYRPDAKSLEKVEKYLQKLFEENPLSFYNKSKWRLNRWKTND